MKVMMKRIQKAKNPAKTPKTKSLIAALSLSMKTFLMFSVWSSLVKVKFAHHGVVAHAIDPTTLPDADTRLETTSKTLHRVAGVALVVSLLREVVIITRHSTRTGLSQGGTRGK